MNKAKQIWGKIKGNIENEELILSNYSTARAISMPKNILFTLSRYKFAAKMMPQNKTIKILELGCGDGFASLILAENGHNVVGVDFDASAIEHANKTINKKNMVFKEGDFLGKKYGFFEAVVSFDVIEHIFPSDENAFMKTIISNLKKTGICLIGTPNKTAAKYASKASKLGHVNLYTAERMYNMMNKYFNFVFIFGMNDEVLHTGFPSMSHYIIALGCGKKQSK